MMPSSFIFDIYVANFDWRRRANLSLKLIWWLFAPVSVVVFVSVCFVAVCSVLSSGGGTGSVENSSNFSYALLKFT